MTNPPDPKTKTPEHRLESARVYKQRNRDRLREWQRQHNAEIRNDPVRYAKKLEHSRLSAKKHRDKRREYDKARDKIKKNARGLVRNHIWLGKLKRLPCERCGNPKSHAHHKDYSRPLDVNWLCPKCHADEHKNEL